MQIKAMFLDGEFFEHYKQVDEFATMFVVMSVYELEDANGYSTTILEQADTVEGLINIMFEFKMILYRLDFNVGQEAKAELLSFMREHDVSSTWMSVMLTTSVLRPLTMALKLQKIFEEEDMHRLRLSILLFLEEYMPGSYRIRDRLAAIYRENGQTEAAAGYQKRIPEMTGEMQSQEEVLFACQELLWKMQYKEAGADRDIVHFLKEVQVEDAFWQFLIEHSPVTDNEYYLRIVELLLESKEQRKAEIVLKRCLQVAPGDEMALCLLADLAIKCGDIDLALLHLSQIKNPSEFAMKFQRTCMELKERKQHG